MLIMLPFTVLPVYSLEVGGLQVKCVWVTTLLPPCPSGSLLVCVCMSGFAFMETMNNIIITVGQTPLL